MVIIIVLQQPFIAGHGGALHKINRRNGFVTNGVFVQALICSVAKICIRKINYFLAVERRCVLFFLAVVMGPTFCLWFFCCIGYLRAAVGSSSS